MQIAAAHHKSSSHMGCVDAFIYLDGLEPAGEISLFSGTVLWCLDAMCWCVQQTCNACQHFSYLHMMQVMLQARQVGEGGDNAGPQGSTDVMYASAHSVKVGVFALAWGPHQP